ncbi:hypothetical protein NFI96_032055 [Prochilodus magdalenae]|nr:hypothetical protein NFI96_032055 [Prochilodus magdalenae]
MDPTPVSGLPTLQNAPGSHERHLQQLTHSISEVTQSMHPNMNTTTMATGAPVATLPLTESPYCPVRIATPDKNDGSPGFCKGFMLQCSLVFSRIPDAFPMDDSKIAFVLSLLTGKALQWAIAVWGAQSENSQTFSSFQQSFEEVFDHFASGKDPGKQLLLLRQGSASAVDHSLTFHTLAAESGWDKKALKGIYHQSLNESLKSELACRDEPLSLSQLIQLSIKLDNMIRSRRHHTPHSFNIQSPVPSAVEPMEFGRARLNAAERQRRLQENRCLFCGELGHFKINCPASCRSPLTTRKCEFHKSTLSYLGYILSPQGVQMDDSKIQAVLKWPQPHTVKELQRFLGFANFYRRFIQNYSIVAAPLTSLLRGHPKRLKWSPAALSAFSELKGRFTSAPILRHPDPSQPFVVEVDASETGLGAVLSQMLGKPSRLHPCAFYSRKLTPAERNYDLGNRELLAVKAALEEWRHWLEVTLHPFTIFTDHRNLEYMRTARRLNARQSRWALFFTRFNFTMTYRPGTKNVKADALSRLYDHPSTREAEKTILPASCIVAPILWAIIDEIQKAQASEPPPPTCPSDKVQKLVDSSLQVYSNRSPYLTDHGPIWLWILLQTYHHLKVSPPSLISLAVSLRLVTWSFCKQLNISVSLTSGFHPQSNEQAERLNQEIGRFLHSNCSTSQHDWSRFLPWAEYAQNSLTSASTGLTPFQCVLGYQPPLFPWSGESSEVPAMDDWMRRSEQTWRSAHVRQQRAIRWQKLHADRQRRPAPTYRPGQRVWLSTWDIF